MLRVQHHGPVIRFLAARPLFGHIFYHVAAYWIDGLLIDTGCRYTARELQRATSSLPVKQIVNTHSHEDHIGGNALMQRVRTVPILAHPLALSILAHPRSQPLEFYRRLVWGRPRSSRASPVGNWLETDNYRLQVIHTPGHSADHISLYEPEQGWLFSGDAFIGGRNRTATRDCDIYTIIASLKTLAGLRLTRLFPGSGTVRDNPGEDIRQKITALAELGREIRRLHQMGLSVGAIKSRLLGREPQLTYLTIWGFSGSHLIEAFLRETGTAANSSRCPTGQRHSQSAQ